MTKRIDRDLFAGLMRMPARERADIFEFLGQSPVDTDSSWGELRPLAQRDEQTDRRSPPVAAMRT